MSADLKAQIERLRQLSSNMLEDVEKCPHFPTQQRLLEAAAKLLQKAEEMADTQHRY